MKYRYSSPILLTPRFSKWSDADCYRYKQRSRIDTEKSYKLIQEGIAANFYGKLPTRYDEKLSTARILDLSLCWTLEMNPRKKSDDYKLEHFGNAVLKGVAVYRCKN